MNLIQQGTKSRAASTPAWFGSARLILAAIVAVAAVALAVVLVAPLINGSRIGSVESQAGPLLQPAAVEFRQSEHAQGVSPESALLVPAAVEFRQSEHAQGVSATSSLLLLDAVVSFDRASTLRASQPRVRSCSRTPSSSAVASTARASNRKDRTGQPFATWWAGAAWPGPPETLVLERVPPCLRTAEDPVRGRGLECSRRGERCVD